MFTLCLGPFPNNQDFNSLDFDVSCLNTKGEEIHLFNYANWKLNNRKMVNEVQDSIGNYLILRFDLFNEEACHLYGDFKFKVRIGIISFYFWLNVLGIKYKELYDDKIGHHRVDVEEDGLFLMQNRQELFKFVLPYDKNL